jgi:hypothetical protein
MEWLALLLLVPAIVVPVVLLLGFAGCGDLFGLKYLPEFEDTFNLTLTNSTGHPNRTIVQRIEPARLRLGGKLIQFTLRSGAGNNIVINKMYVSQAVGPGIGDPYDSAADLTEVTTGSINLDQNSSKTLDYVNYVLDPTKPLIVSFDIDTPGATSYANLPYDGKAPEASAYVGPYNEAEAGIADRQSPPAYTEEVNRIYLIEKIEVSNG